MQRSRWPLYILVFALACATVIGFTRLFQLRYEVGDIYPPYSSLRADPLGAAVLYQALDDAGGCTVTRNFLPLSRIADAAKSKDATIFYLGARLGGWSLDDVKALESLATSGARVVITFLPQEQATKSSHESLRPEKKPKKPAGDDQDTDEPLNLTSYELAKRWNLDFNWRLAQDRDNPQTPGLTARASIPGPERTVPWHTALYFKSPIPALRVIYQVDGQPVLLERKFGRGSFVFSSDSYLFSNEAMRADRAPRLLAWLIGDTGSLPPASIIFEETHLGVQENPGIAALARKYGLQGFAAALLALASLYIWQSGAPFLPPRREEAGSDIVAGQDSASGFVSLLRRGIAPPRLLAACLEQWKKSFAHRPEKKMQATLARIEAAAAGADPVASYRMISQILAEKK